MLTKLALPASITFFDHERLKHRCYQLEHVELTSADKTKQAASNVNKERASHYHHNLQSIVNKEP